MGNFHCVYNITSDKGCVNLSIIQFTYIGINFKSFLKHMMTNEHCLQGGVAFGMQQLCNNYTSKLKINNDKYIMGIVSGTRDSLIFIIYSFKGYCHVSVEVTVSSTPCRGIFFSGGKYLCLN